VNDPRILLRPVRPDEGPQLAEIAREAYGKYAGLLAEPPAPLLLDYDEVAGSGRTYVAEDAGRLLGMVTAEPGEHDMVLRNLAVRPASQGRGIGRRLAVLVEELARTRDKRGVRLWTRAEMSDNIAFYKSLDYIITHSEQTAEASRVFFCKDLA
jgi:ribosomal protein S18 acetylase RimI-like enzyme